ncbi:MAG: hemerythrin family protein, partial [Leptospiraceae bacterium]|nr:hemerythrin family protein [Leptospiraceae bacterium]
QHLWLIKMTVELDSACKNMASKKREEVFRSIIKGAVQYAKEHFYLEEKIMQKFHYLAYTQHYKQHQSFMEFVQLRYKEFKEGDIKAASNLVMDLKEWLLGHIAIEDKNMGAALRDFHGDIITYTRDIIKNGELKIKKSQVDLYNKIMGIKTF